MAKSSSEESDSSTEDANVAKLKEAANHEFSANAFPNQNEHVNSKNGATVKQKSLRFIEPSSNTVGPTEDKVNTELEKRVAKKLSEILDKTLKYKDRRLAFSSIDASGSNDYGVKLLRSSKELLTCEEILSNGCQSSTNDDKSMKSKSQRKPEIKRRVIEESDAEGDEEFTKKKRLKSAAVSADWVLQQSNVKRTENKSK